MRLRVLASALLLSCGVAQGQYVAAFDAEPGDEWSTRQVDFTPLEGDRFLGQFGNESVRLTLASDGGPVQLKVRLLIINSWDGNDPDLGPDVFGIRIAGGPDLLLTTFSNLDENDWPQSFPDAYGAGDNPAYMGAAAVDSLGYTYYGDATYDLELSFAATPGVIVVEFFAEGLQDVADESWGLSSVVVVGALPLAVARTATTSALAFNGPIIGPRVATASDTLTFSGPDIGPRIATADGTLIFGGPHIGPRTAEAATLIFVGPHIGPRVATASGTLTFSGPDIGPRIATADGTLIFGGPHIGPRTADAERLIFGGPDAGPRRATAPEPLSYGGAAPTIRKERSTSQ